MEFAGSFGRQTVAVACPEDRETLAAIRDAAGLGLCAFLLYGNEAKIKACLSAGEGIEIIHTEDAVRMAVQACALGKAQVLMKGLVDTKALIKEYLNTEHGLRKALLSHIMIMEPDNFGRLLFLSDGGLNINPTVSEMQEITLSAIAMAQHLGVTRPKVALLSAVEKVNPKMESTVKCRQVCELLDQKGDYEIAGPLSLDLALSKDAAAIKGMNNGVCGEADILIAPHLEVANFIYKTWVLADKKLNSAGIVVGGKVPIVLTSRSDSHRSKLHSLGLALALKGKYE
jgi:phosphate butyryltransferase